MKESVSNMEPLMTKVQQMYRGKVVGILPREKFEKYEIGRLMSGFELESK